MSEIVSRQVVSLEYWPNGSKVTTCRAWLHANDWEVLELDERRLANKDERQQILADLTDTPAEIRAELADLLATAAIGVLEAQDRARQAREAKGNTKPGKAEAELQWDEPVDGSELMTELIAYLTKYIVFPSERATLAVALWIIMTHVHHASEFSPLLIFTSPTRGSGKTRALEVLALLVLRPWKVISPSDAVMYRKVDQDHLTPLFDEADNTSWRNRPGLVALLNGGFAKSGAVVPRCVGEDFEPRDFSVWAPKALATKGLKGLPDTTLSRSVIIHLRRRKKDSEPVTRFRERVVRAEAAPLRAMLIRWATDSFEGLVSADPNMPETISDRAADAWSPLVGIADALGADWGKQAREAAEELSGAEQEASDIAEELLADIRGILEPKDDDGKPLSRIERITSTDLVERLRALEGRQWADWSRGKGLSAGQLASLLDPFGIGPRQLKFEKMNRRGYDRAQFDDAFSRNLPAGCYPATSDGTKGVTAIPQGATDARGSGTQTGANSFNPIRGSGVAPESPKTGSGPTKPEVRPCMHPEPLATWTDAAGVLVCGRCHPDPSTSGQAP